METLYRPLTAKQRKELQGIIAWSTRGCGVLMFLAATAAIGGLFCFGHRLLVHGLLSAFSDRSDLLGWLLEVLSPAIWWIVPAIVCAGLLYKVSGRWTGGPAYRQKVRQDLARGEAVVTCIKAIDAVKVAEIEDEGPTFFLQLDDGRVMALSGQFLDGHIPRGFPWQEMEIIEAPESRHFFGLKRAGKPLRPSRVLEPSSWDDVTRLQSAGHYQLVDIDFDELRSGRMDSLRSLPLPAIPGEDVTRLEIPVRYHDGVTTVEPGDRVRARLLLRRRLGRISSVPGISPFHPELEHGGLLDVGITFDNGTFTSVTVDPETHRLPKSVELLERGSAAEAPPPPEAPFE